MTDDNSALDAVDERILGEIRSLTARMDPTPAGLTSRVKYALTVQALHAEVAELVELTPAATRGVDAQRTETITFAHGALSLMVNIGADPGSHARVDGWVTSGRSEIEAVASGTSFFAVADENGRFVLEHVPRGRVYFVVRVTSDEGPARPVVTPVIEI